MGWRALASMPGLSEFQAFEATRDSLPLRLQNELLEMPTVLATPVEAATAAAPAAATGSRGESPGREIRHVPDDDDAIGGAESEPEPEPESVPEPAPVPMSEPEPGPVPAPEPVPVQQPEPVPPTETVTRDDAASEADAQQQSESVQPTDMAMGGDAAGEADAQQQSESVSLIATSVDGGSGTQQLFVPAPLTVVATGEGSSGGAEARQQPEPVQPTDTATGKDAAGEADAQQQPEPVPDAQQQPESTSITETTTGDGGGDAPDEAASVVNPGVECMSGSGAEQSTPPRTLFDCVRADRSFGVLSNPSDTLLARATAVYNRVNGLIGDLSFDPIIVTSPPFTLSTGEADNTSIKNFYALGALTRLRLLADTNADMEWLAFKLGNRNYAIVSLKGLRIRQEIASSITEDALRDMRRRRVTPERRMELLAELHAAGVKTCPCSGLPVFDPHKAPPALFKLFDNLRLALNGDSNALRAAAIAAGELSRALQTRITH